MIPRRLERCEGEQWLAMSGASGVHEVRAVAPSARSRPSAPTHLVNVLPVQARHAFSVAFAYVDAPHGLHTSSGTVDTRPGGHTVQLAATGTTASHASPS